jgi:hypothetical protein
MATSKELEDTFEALINAGVGTPEWARDITIAVLHLLNNAATAAEVAEELAEVSKVLKAHTAPPRDAAKQ